VPFIAKWQAKGVRCQKGDCFCGQGTTSFEYPEMMRPLARKKPAGKKAETALTWGRSTKSIEVNILDAVRWWDRFGIRHRAEDSF